MIILGIGIGSYYGLVLNPVELVDTTPATLRVDYSTDYVLMVAEAFSVDGDAALAARRLANLGAKTPPETMQSALIFALEQNYTPNDLLLMRDLSNALATWNPALDGASP